MTQVLSEKVVEEMFAGEDGYLNAVQDCDAVRLAQFYTLDAVYRVEGRPTITGRNQIEAMFSKDFDDRAHKVPDTPTTEYKQFSLNGLTAHVIEGCVYNDGTAESVMMTVVATEDGPRIAYESVFPCRN